MCIITVYQLFKIIYIYIITNYDCCYFYYLFLFVVFHLSSVQQYRVIWKKNKYPSKIMFKLSRWISLRSGSLTDSERNMSDDNASPSQNIYLLLFRTSYHQKEVLKFNDPVLTAE